uniref:GDP-Man:Man(3)GlcNAc(2)-PP-Dol alpha-1,2-mannosyltransferase n=1 Tax=Aceria tosichella TaxID=561515 RepID=A0A6G1SG94_9ACAR
MIRTIGYFALVAFLYWLIIRWWLRRARRKNTIGIFHLYCSSGGGGERVLWHLVKILLEKYPKYTIYIYTQKELHQDSLQILLKARNLFKIDLLADDRALERLEFVPLSLSPWIEAKKYPFLTLLFQNLISVIVAFQAAYNIVPEVYFETIGFTFTLPVFKLAGSRIATYIHYPTISSDMIHNVETTTHASYNNRQVFVRFPLLRQLKLVYYKLLVFLYGYAGRSADTVMVNSSWTQKHIESLWSCKAVVVYPPCDVDSFKALPLERFEERLSSKVGQSNLNIISIAQFRPEKNHQMQIEAFDMFMNRVKHSNDSQLTLYGGCRGAEDQKLVEYLRDLINRLDLSSRVSLVVNASFEELLDGLHEADVAIHTMVNEHFGIVMLEFMAAGLITIAHNSGGPKADIIDDQKNGFLCDDINDFAEKLALISKMSFQERQTIRKNAIEKSEKFSNARFESSITKELDAIMIS